MRVKGGPEPGNYSALELRDGNVARRAVGRPPEPVDVVYVHRPLGELPQLVATAKSLGARAVWYQSGLASAGTKDPKSCWLPEGASARARILVESAGLRYVDDVYIADAVRGLGEQRPARHSVRRFRYVLVDVFTKTRLQGNPLAVFPSAAGLSDDEMQQIAGELNLSETVFFFEPASRDAAVKVRIFTPRRELDFAGHPTIGSAYVLCAERSQPGGFAIEENIGLVPISAETDGDGDRVFWLTTPRLSFFETLERGFCARLLGLSLDDVAADCPPQFVSAGSPFLFVCLRTPEAVDRARLQHAHLDEACGSVNAVGTFVFARSDPGSSSRFDVYSRMFAPQTGIPEDPATGSATGPLAGYMLRHGKLPNRTVAFKSEQGVKMGRRSILHVRVQAAAGEATIEVGGSVVAVAEGTFSL